MKPLCLGRDPVEGHWFFYGEKEGVGRFIRYFVWKDVAYPHWASSTQVPSILSITQVPSDELVTEVEQFSQGLLKYEVIPKSRGRAERVIKSTVDATTGVSTVDDKSDLPQDRSDKRSDRRSTKRDKHNVSSGSAQSAPIRNGVAALKSTSTNVVIKPRVLGETAQITSGTVEAKPKRKRRTKSEMELVKLSNPQCPVAAAPVVEVAVVIEHKRKRRTKLEMEEFRKSLK